jgi:site-specific recombinase XerD
LQCGELRRKKGPGLCHRCWTNHPSRPITQAANLAGQLSDPPEWLVEFAEFAVERHCVARSCVMVSALGRLLTDGETQHPQALLERSRTPGRSAGALARTLEEFFVEHHLAFGLDQQARLAAGRRQRRVDGAPAPLRLAVAAFADHLIRSRERARHAGTLQRADSTIEGTIAIVRDLARFVVSERHKSDWATVDVSDLEAFLAAQPRNKRRRLSASRQFFTWARKAKIVLVDPTRSMPAQRSRVLAGDTLTVTEQRRLFRRWTAAGRHDVHPHEAFVGLMALLHAASSSEIRQLRVDDIDQRRQSIRLGGRPHPVPLDPVTAAALQRCLQHRHALASRNPHLIVTKVTKPRQTPASMAYMSHILDPAEMAIKRLRCTRLLDMIVSLDPKVVAEALGMNAGGLVSYLADSVDAGRLADRA